ncbi:MAG: glycoside hydrolase family 2, partial [Candidatus Saccharibacteria bacterium]|nr:glycoside hydrolase family 2 [Pseudorhodobacter sp.]
MVAVGSVRDVTLLDGVWDFIHHSDGLQRQATVPGPWQAAFADLRQSYGHATYARTVVVPQTQDAVFLCFGAVSHSAVVRIAGQDIGRHDNGWLPFEVRVPDDLKGQTVALQVDCHLPGPDDAGPDSFADIPHGKMGWYGPTGGLWQSVRLETRPARHLTHCAITADPATGKVAVQITETGSGPRDVSVVFDGAVVAHGDELTVANPRMWSPDDPALYRVRVDLDGDVTEHSFGFRSFTAKDGQMFLNGKPFYMRAALDQDYYPQSICTPPSTAYLEDQFHKARSLGLNMLRFHIKVPDPRYLEVADRLGML